MAGSGDIIRGYRGCEQCIKPISKRECLGADDVANIVLGPSWIGDVAVALVKRRENGRLLAGHCRIVEHLDLIPFEREMAVRHQHDHLVFHARPAEYSKEIDSEHSERRNARQEARVIGLGQILDVMRGIADKAPAPIWVTGAEGQLSQAEELAHAYA